MGRAVSSKRYAQAVFEIAVENDSIEQWTEDLFRLSIAVENLEFISLLDAPQIPSSIKTQTIRDVLGDSVDVLSINLLAVLGARNLTHLLPTINDEFGRLLDEHHGIARGELISAVPLNDKQIEKTNKILDDLIGRPVRLTASVDTEIIGGIVGRVGDRVVDGSVRGQLQSMRKTVVDQI